MGENEQGGMLRTVVVVGLVAMLTVIIVSAVVSLSASSKANIDNATNSVSKVNNDVMDGWQAKDPVKPDWDSSHGSYQSGSWELITLSNPDMGTSETYPEPWGYKYNLPQVTGLIKPNQTVRIRFELKSLVDRQLKLDANTNIVDQASHPDVSGNDQDDISSRKIIVNDKVVAQGDKTLAGENSTNGFTMKANEVYEMEINFTNKQSVSLIDQGTSLRFNPVENGWADFKIGIRNIQMIVS